MTLSQHVHTLGRGPGRARSLTRDEAHDAMRQMLVDTCAPEVCCPGNCKAAMVPTTPDLRRCEA